MEIEQVSYDRIPVSNDVVAIASIVVGQVLLGCIEVSKGTQLASVDWGYSLDGEDKSPYRPSYQT
jgi:hypothetical protein